MNTELPLIDAAETLIHIGMTLEEVSEFMVNEDRSDADIEDFIDNVEILSSLVKIYQYCTIREDYIDGLRSI